MAAPVIHRDWNDLVLKLQIGFPVSTPSLYIHLFTADYTPDCHATTGDMPDPTDISYSIQPVVYSDWTLADYPTAGACARKGETLNYTFTFSTGDLTVYGLYVYDSPNNVIAWAQRFDTALYVPPGGGAVTVSLSLIAQECA